MTVACQLGDISRSWQRLHTYFAPAVNPIASFIAMRCEPMAGIKVFSFFSYSHTNWLSKTSIYSSGPIVLDQVFAEIFAAGFPLFIIMIHRPAYFSGKYADSFDWQFFKIIKASSESLQSMLNWFEYWSHHFEIPSAILWLNAVYYIVLKYFQNLLFPYQRFSCTEWMNEDNILMKAFLKERKNSWMNASYSLIFHGASGHQRRVSPLVNDSFELFIPLL